MSSVIFNMTQITSMSVIIAYKGKHAAAATVTLMRGKTLKMQK